MNLSPIMQEVYRFNFNWLLKLGSLQINSTEFPDASVVIGRIDYLSFLVARQGNTFLMCIFRQRASDLQYMTRL